MASGTSLLEPEQTARSVAIPPGRRHPLDEASCLSHASYTWVYPILDLGNVRPLVFDDLWPLTDEDRTEPLMVLFRAGWAKADPSSPNRLMWALWHGFGRYLMATGVYRILNTFIGTPVCTSPSLSLSLSLSLPPLLLLLLSVCPAQLTPISTNTILITLVDFVQPLMLKAIVEFLQDPSRTSLALFHL